MDNQSLIFDNKEPTSVALSGHDNDRAVDNVKGALNIGAVIKPSDLALCLWRTLV